MFSYIRGIILLFVTAYVALIYKSVPISMLAFAQAVILVLSFLYLYLESRNLSVKAEVPIPITEANTPVSLVIDVSSTSKLAITKIRIHYIYRKKGKWLHISNVTKERQENRIKLSFSKPGRHLVKVNKVKVYDLFGMYYITRRINENGMYFVLPEIKSYDVKISEGVRNFEGDADIYDELRAGNDPTETFQIREYRPGDKVQSIHWKLSAKGEETYVRENGYPKACPVVVLLDKADITLVASLSFSLMDAGCPHFCSWKQVSTGEMIRGRVDDEESFYLMLISYMKDGIRKNTEDLREQFKDKYHESNYIHWIHVTDKILIDGEQCNNEEIVL